jgi:hypothetical protein
MGIRTYARELTHGGGGLSSSPRACREMLGLLELEPARADLSKLSIAVAVSRHTGPPRLLTNVDVERPELEPRAEFFRCQ